MKYCLNKQSFWIEKNNEKECNSILKRNNVSSISFHIYVHFGKKKLIGNKTCSKHILIIFSKVLSLIFLWTWFLSKKKVYWLIWIVFAFQITSTLQRRKGAELRLGNIERTKGKEEKKEEEEGEEYKKAKRRWDQGSWTTCNPGFQYRRGQVGRGVNTSLLPYSHKSAHTHTYTPQQLH